MGPRFVCSAKHQFRLLQKKKTKKTEEQSRKERKRKKQIFTKITTLTINSTDISLL